MIEVSAGIVFRPSGEILVCRRGEGRKHAHLWEFPGGKREKGETAEETLRRELMEELSLPIADVKPVYVKEAEGIRFTFLTAQTTAQPIPTEHEEVFFAHPREMLMLSFCPADVEVACRLALNDPPVRHFFWDFDGTVMDTYPLMSRSAVRAAASLGLTVTQDKALQLMKNNLTFCLETLAQEAGVSPAEMTRAFREEEERHGWEGVAPMPGMDQALRLIRERGGRHYLFTHRDRGALDMLEKTGLLDCFDDFVTREDGFARKPEPDGLLHLMQKHGLSPDQCVMIGDRPLDTASGRSAGMLSCMFDPDGRFTTDPSELYCDHALALARLFEPLT